jgi:hypothetical protein
VKQAGILVGSLKMASARESAGGLVSVISSTTSTPGNGTPATPSFAFVRRDGNISIGQLIDLYMASYVGRDVSRPQRLGWWTAKLGHLTLNDLTDDEIFHALEELATRKGRYWAGIDADGAAVYRSKNRPLASASNRKSLQRRVWGGTLLEHQAPCRAQGLEQPVQIRRTPRRGQRNSALSLRQRTNCAAR